MKVLTVKFLQTLYASTILRSKYPLLDQPQSIYILLSI
jgi:hypothetical protein